MPNGHSLTLMGEEPYLGADTDLRRTSLGRSTHISRHYPSKHGEHSR
jgi:hypothetical protein